VLAISNGTNGGSETNEQKQFSFRTEYITSKWRIGSSYNLNAAPNDNNREIVNIFSSGRVLGLDWLFEIDKINDNSSTPKVEQLVYFLEVNTEIKKGNNLKLSYEIFDSNIKINQNQQTRSSIVYEYSPFEFTQVRTGYRAYDGIPQNTIQNRQELFFQLHNYF